MKYGVSNTEDPKEYRRRQTAESRRRNPIQYLINQVKYRSKKRGLDFDLTLSDLEVPEVCPILGIPLEHSEGGRTDSSYSLDRVDNSKGYVKGNVRVISFGANMRKGDLTIAQVSDLLSYMKGEL